MSRLFRRFADFLRNVDKQCFEPSKSLNTGWYDLLGWQQKSVLSLISKLDRICILYSCGVVSPVDTITTSDIFITIAI